MTCPTPPDHLQKPPSNPTTAVCLVNHSHCSCCPLPHPCFIADYGDDNKVAYFDFVITHPESGKPARFVSLASRVETNSVETFSLDNTIDAGGNKASSSRAGVGLGHVMIYTKPLPVEDKRLLANLRAEGTKQIVEFVTRGSLPCGKKLYPDAKVQARVVKELQKHIAGIKSSPFLASGGLALTLADKNETPCIHVVPADPEPAEQVDTSGMSLSEISQIEQPDVAHNPIIIKGPRNESTPQLKSHLSKKECVFTIGLKCVVSALSNGEVNVGWKVIVTSVHAKNIQCTPAEEMLAGADAELLAMLGY